MTAKGYCLSDDVADFLATSFTPTQAAHCEVLIEQAEAFIDTETNRGWLMGVQTDEAFYYPPYNIFVRYAPIASVQQITAQAALNEAETTLTVNVDYEIRDTTTGQINLISPLYHRIHVDYTPVATVPADIRLACTELVGHWMQPHLQPGSYGLDSITLPDLSIKYSRAHVQTVIPPTVGYILDRYRYKVHG